MNAIGELIIWLMCVGAFWGIVLTTTFIGTIWLIYKIWRDENGKH